MGCVAFDMKDKRDPLGCLVKCLWEQQMEGLVGTDGRRPPTDFLMKMIFRLRCPP